MNIVKKTSKASYRFIIISLLITLLTGLAAAYNWESIKAFEFDISADTSPKTNDPAFLTIGVCDTAGPIEVEASLVGPGPTAYATLGAAFTAINAGMHTGVIAVEVCGDTNEGTATATLNASGSGAASYSFMLIRPVGGVARTISGATTAGNPMIDLNGADNVTINGINTGGDSLTISNTTVSGTSGTSTIRFQADATSNTITNTSVLGSATMQVGSNGGNIWFGSAAITTGNDDNTISNCNIGPAGVNLPSKAIYFSGSSNTNPGTANSGITISGNNIFDYFSATLESAGIDLNSGTVGTIISNNKFYQTASRIQTVGRAHSVIRISNTSGNGYQITGNTIGFASSAGTGTYTFVGVNSASTFFGINLSVGTTTATSVQNNTVAGISMSGAVSGTSSSAAFRGIYVGSGLATVGDVTGNTIGSMAATGSISYTSSSASASDVIGIFNFGSSNFTTNNNNVGGIIASNSSTGAANIYGIRTNTGSSVTWTCLNNTVGGNIANSINSTSTATGTIVNGILNSNPIGTFTGNTIRNMTVAGGTGTTTSASMAGIVITSTANQTIGTNTIHTLTNTNATAASIVTGIQFTGGTANVVERNFIYNLLAPTTSTAAEINGIRVSGGTTSYRNNMIALGANQAIAIGTTATNSSTVGINGFNGALGTDTFVHNSVYIGGTATSGAGNSYAFNGVQTVNTRSFRDNIFFNARNNSGATGKNYAIKINGTTANPTGLTLNNNLYFVNGSGGVFGFFNSSDVANLAAWKVAVGQDAGSFESNPQFLDATNAVPDLHLHPTNPTPAESNGVDVGVTNDFDGKTRSGLTPVDIGADAGNFAGLDLAVPNITYTPLLNTSSTANRIQNVTITDVSGVATGGSAPRIYFNKNGGAYFSTACSLVTGTVNNGTWDCTIDNSLIGGVVVSDVIRYYVVAQDIVGNLASNPSAGFSGTNVNSITTPPTTPNQYTIVGTISGSINVGVGETYTSLTNAGGIFEVINNSEVNGNITINITSDLSGELGTNGLNTFASPYTITINPSGAARTITGSFNSALIRMNGASRVTIDGSIGGIGTDRSLTITNTSATSPNVVLIGSTGTTPVTNDTLKNCIIINGVNTSSAVVISDAAAVGNAGFFSNITIQNNDIQKAFVGVFASGGTTPQNGSNLTYTQNILNTSGTNAIRNVGLYMQGVNGATVSNNIISNFNTTNDENDTGIWLASGTINATVSGNTVAAIGYTGTVANTTFGIRDSGNAAASDNNITGNSVLNITSNGSPTTNLAAIGIDNVSGGTVIQKNNVQGINATNAGTYGAAGINIIGGNNAVVRNNFVSDVTGNMTGGAAFSTTFGVFGLRVAAGTGHQIYNNSVNLYGLRAGTATTSLLTAAFAIVNTTSTGMDVRNNVFANNITGGTTSVANVAVYLPSGGTSAMNLTMNNNAYFFGTDAARQGVGQGGTTAGTNFFTTLPLLAAYSSTLHVPVTNDNASQGYTTAPPFVSNTDLHLNDPMSPLVGAGDGIGSITNDFDMDPRPVSNTDIGADELVQSTAGSFPSGIFYNAILAGSDTLSGDVTIKNTLTLTGISNTGSNTLIIGCNATVNGASATNYVVGIVQKDFCATGAFTFPVGTPNDGMLVGEESSPVTVNVTALGQNPSALRVSATDDFLPGLLQATAVSRYWTLSEVGDLTADLTFQYLDQDINGNESLYKVFRRAGGLTTEQSPNSNNPAANQATATGVSNFSDWGIGELAPTAAGVEVGGRVVKGDGQGIGRARLVLTDTLGNSRLTQTNAFGYYKFEDVEAGQTVTITVSAKQYVFNQATRVINLGESVTDADFIASGENYLLNNGDSYFDKAPLDFDGDGRTDISVFRADKSSWLINYSSDNRTAKQAFGLPTDILAPADFDGDGRTDYGVFRASEGTWYIWNSSTNDLRVERFGTGGDIPVPADFDGDLKADLILWNANGWTVKQSSDGRTVEIASENTDKSGIPILADYDTDGKADLTIFVKSSGTWRILLSSTGETVTVKFGNGATDSAMMGDFDGDFRADLAVYNQGVWTIRNTRTSEISTIQTLAGEAVIGDFDGDNRLDATVYQNGRWTLRQSAGGLVKVREFGSIGDLAIPSILVK